MEEKKTVLKVLRAMIDKEGDENKSEVLINLLRMMVNNTRDDKNLADLLKDVNL